MPEAATLRKRRSVQVGEEFSLAPPEGENRVRLTVYMTPEKDFAVRYLALKRHKSVNKLLNDQLDFLLREEGINPESLQSQLP